MSAFSVTAARCLLVGLLGLVVSQRPTTVTAAANVPNDERAIVHALNRLAFGPRPGDVDRVRKLGLATWIDQQLRPDRINDTAMDSRLARLTTLSRESEELAQDFIAARQERRQRQRATGREGAAEGTTTPGQATQRPGDAVEPAMEPMGTSGQRPALMSEAAQRERRAFAEMAEAKIAPRGLQRPSTRRGAGRFLVQPFQRLRAEGSDGDLRRRIRARGDSSPRSWQFSRTAWSNGEESRDAGVSRQLDERRSERRISPRESPTTERRCQSARASASRRTATWRAAIAKSQRPQPDAARPQRKLRARAARAAHARCGRRLHPAGCRRGRSSVYGVDDWPSRRSRVPLCRRPCTIAARRKCSGTILRPAAASKTARKSSTSWRVIRRPLGTSRSSSPNAS